MGFNTTNKVILGRQSSALQIVAALHTQSVWKEEGEMTASLHRRPGSPAPLIEDDDLLNEIRLRMSPLPSSLPRASLVSDRYCRLVSRGEASPKEYWGHLHCVGSFSAYEQYFSLIYQEFSLDHQGQLTH